VRSRLLAPAFLHDENERCYLAALMSLQAFALSRVHCFRSEVRVRVAPLTLVYGQNNAGKSTLLRSLALLAASVGTPKSAALDLSSEAAAGASYRDIRSRLDSLNEVKFTLTFDHEQTVTFTFMAEADSAAHTLAAIDYRDGNGELVTMRISVEKPQHYELVRGDVTEWSGPVGFAGIRPENLDTLPVPQQTALQRIATQLDKLRTSLVWLTAVRAKVPRKRPIPNNAPDRRADGAWVQDHLGRDALAIRRELKDAVSAELEGMFECALHVEMDERDAVFQGIPNGTSWKFPFADLGEGVTQVLPVITLGCMAERGELGQNPILCIEQPEMHLHESAERKLATFFARIAKCPSAPQLVIETHSDILLTAILLAVAEGRLSASDVAIHWVGRESANTESFVHRVDLDDRGNPQQWPAGALAERSELARSLFYARRR